MRLCTGCVLPESFPGIRFDAAGMCNYCREFAARPSAESLKARYRTKFDGIVNQVRGTSEYDCVLAYSGGKDSTYTLWLLRERYRLNVLAVTFDNGFVSPDAFTNIRRSVETLNVDHILVKPRFDLLRKIFAEVSESGLFPAKALERASSICTACISLVKNATLRIAIEKHAPILAWGFSSGQADMRASILKMNALMLRAMHDSRSLPLLKIAGDAVRSHLLNESHFAEDVEFPYNVNFLGFHDCSEEDELVRIRELGWQEPRDTDGNSSNCLLNAYANRQHIQKFGFHPYAFEVAGLVRAGALSREEGLAKLENLGNESTCRAIAMRLGVREEF